MEYRAEIFDRMQSLFHETGFNDHQLHCEIRLGSSLDEATLQRAVADTLAAIPILATRYVETPDGGAAWASLPAEGLGRAFATTESEEGFEAERTCRLLEGLGPQLRVCLLRGERGALAITMNHMITDGAGFKDYLYFLCDRYSRLREDPLCPPPPPIDGDRGIARVTRAFGFRSKLGAWLGGGGDSNRRGDLSFPFADEPNARPFIATRALSREKVSRLKDYCAARGATLNDAVLAAYYRVLGRLVGPVASMSLEIPIMVDMRRYLPSRKFDSLRNLASTVVTRLRPREGESFEETLAKAKKLMDALKARKLGLGGFVKMSLLFSLFGERAATRLLRHGLKNPLVCMTNIGEIDSGRLRFAGVEVLSAYVCGSIKYKPHFQLAVSGFGGGLTLSSNLYGGDEDRRRVDAFLAEVEGELDLRSPGRENGPSRAST